MYRLLPDETSTLTPTTDSDTSSLSFDEIYPHLALTGRGTVVHLSDHHSFSLNGVTSRPKLPQKHRYHLGVEGKPMALFSHEGTLYVVTQTLISPLEGLKDLYLACQRANIRYLSPRTILFGLYTTPSQRRVSAIEHNNLLFAIINIRGPRPYLNNYIYRPWSEIATIQCSYSDAVTALRQGESVITSNLTGIFRVSSAEFAAKSTIVRDRDAWDIIADCEGNPERLEIYIETACFELAETLRRFRGVVST